MENIYLKLYDANDTYMSPSGALMDAERVAAHYPASQSFAYIVQTDASGEMMYGFYSLSAMKSKYGIVNSNLVQAVQAIEDAMNAEQEAQEAEAQAAAEMVTPEERIAAALELQALMSMPDMEVEE